MAFAFEEKGELNFIIRLMQVTCYFSLIIREERWLGPPLKLPQKIPKVAKRPLSSHVGGDHGV